MTITPGYIPGPNQADSDAQARAAALGVGVSARDVPPIYRPFVTTLPGVVAEYGGFVVYLPDDGTITAQAITTAVAPLLAAQQADATTATNLATLKAKAQAALTANANFLAIPSPTTAQAVAQVQTLTKEVNALIRLLLGQLDSTAGT